MRKRRLAQNNKLTQNFENLGVHLVHIEGVRYKISNKNIEYILISNKISVWEMRKRWITQNKKLNWDFKNLGVHLVHTESVRYKISNKNIQYLLISNKISVWVGDEEEMDSLEQQINLGFLKLGSILSTYRRCEIQNIKQKY